MPLDHAGRERRLARVFALLLLAAGLAYNVHWIEPEYNWDLLPYLGVAARFSGASPEKIHDETYRIVRDEIPARARPALLRGTAYRRACADEADVFFEQLPFYRAKPAYPFLLRLLEDRGVGAVRASLLVSRTAYVLIGVTLFFWASTFLGPATALAASYLAASLPFSIRLAALSTPDALSTLFQIAAFLLLAREGKGRWALLLLLLSISVRPDNVLLLVLAGAWVALVRREGWRAPVLLGGAGVVLDAAILRWSGHPGWATLFHHSFVESLPRPLEFDPVLTAGRYLRVYLRQAHPAHAGPFLLLFLMLGAVAALVRRALRGGSDRLFQLVLLVLLAMAGHWLLYPGESDRMFAGYYLVILFALIDGAFGIVRRDPGPAGESP